MSYDNPFGDLNVVLALGDHYRGSIMTLRAAGIELYNPDVIEDGKLAVLTGDECKRDEQGKMINHAPDFALFTNNPEYKSKAPRVSIFHPQDHPKWLERGDMDVAIGPGYDILIDYSGSSPLTLNGKFRTDIKGREGLMTEELLRADYAVAVPLGFKPIIFNLVTTYGTGMRTLKDMRNHTNVVGVSVCPHILKEFFIQQDINGEVVDAFGGVESQVRCGCGNVMSEVTEKGRSLKKGLVKKTANVEENNKNWWWILGDDNEPEIVTYSTAFFVASQKGYKKGQHVIEEVVSLLEGDDGAIAKIKREHPEMFEEGYTSILGEIKERQLAMVA